MSFFTNCRWKQKNKAQKIRCRRAGIKPVEVWNLNDTIVDFTLPRLKAYRANLNSYPHRYANVHEYQKDLDKVINGMELYIKVNNWDVDPSIENNEIIVEAFSLFGKLLPDMWD